MLGEVTAFFLQSQVIKTALSSISKALSNSILKRLGEQTVENSYRQRTLENGA